MRKIACLVSQAFSLRLKTNKGDMIVITCRLCSRYVPQDYQAEEVLFQHLMYLHTMKILLEIPDNKTETILKLLKNYTYVRTQQLTDERAQVIAEVREAVEEMNLIKEDKKSGRPVQDLLDEL